MNVASFFSGVGGLDLGLERAGLRVVSQCEADPWRRRVLAWHWPGVPITDDVRSESGWSAFVEDRSARAGRDRLTRGGSGAPDLVCGGVPCQDWSVAGKRAGIRGSRSGLFFDWCDRIADELGRGGARWIVFENVPGLLSAGPDFGIVLATLADLGYGLAWRVLDARFCGVPQRRRRVFVVGHSGGEPEPAVRALGAGGEGDLEAGRCSWQKPAPGAGGGTVARCLVGNKGQRWDGETEIQQGLSVRRLSVVECERLMSWPDGWTAVDGDATPDGRRYAACGDGVVSNVSEWIGRRILAVDREMAR